MDPPEDPKTEALKKKIEKMAFQAIEKLDQPKNKKENKNSSATVMDDEVEDEDTFGQLPTKTDPKNGARWKLNNQRILLTYKTHLDKVKYKEGLIEKIHFDPPFIRLAHETGDARHNYDHTHVLIDFGKAFQTTDCRFFDVKDETNDDIIHPNLQNINTAKHFGNCKNYLAKEDPENADLKSKATLFTAVTSCNDIQEALGKYCHEPSDACGVVTMYKHKPRKPMKDRTHRMNRWQLQLYERVARDAKSQSTDEEELHGIDRCHIKDENGKIIGIKPAFSPEEIEAMKNKPYDYVSGDDRKNIVILDDKGNIDGKGGKTGKTKSGMWLMAHNPTKYLCIQGMSKASDMATVIANAKANGWDGHCLFINFAREQEDHKMYASLEMLRDGMITTFKYSGESFQVDVHHLVIFTNFMPRLTGTSADRWELYRIDPKVKLLIPLSFEEGIRIYEERQKEKQEKDNGEYFSCSRPHT